MYITKGQYLTEVIALHCTLMHEQTYERANRRTDKWTNEWMHYHMN